ncbi:MAG: hypothetical protein ACH36C_07855 [Ilumatobacteraceae bacterium]
MLSLLILDIHKAWAWVAIISNGLAGIWALAAHKITPLRTRALWWYTGVAEFTIFIQVTLGVIMVNKNKLEFPAFHAFYGFVAIMAVAIIYSYRHQLKNKTYLLYGFGGLFLMGLGIRAMLVGQA